ncbi:protein of unknown function [Taphrina deformans PYCC 5710]|uniref:Uncharacterized protein n=1 Tax=Taphrina deformans (strain PYCC 5710 / ATCC 11124 / CBS 356.35 / IMI 108563 / JCM 9778 / NBRC 8474) TaxID=1097556 RepID=R4XIH5_TAPDE|nr:protein of unknown function [Taphrina deformans PYCC 5710]|eukprot:CCG84304.1 protein of unknown function [Taphrina deformans PYCC 5710]
MHARPAALADQLVAKHSSGPTTSPRVLVIGTAFKPGQSVIFCSPSILFAHRTQELGCRVSYIDPLVAQAAVPTVQKMQDGDFTAAHIDAHFDLVVIAMRQVGLDYEVLDHLAHAKVESFVDMYQEPQSAMRRESRCR